tara:strand:- start:12365 stop:13831 length:1467 start_codon:yes stop_codon:yes gene_type:complete
MSDKKQQELSESDSLMLQWSFQDIEPESTRVGGEADDTSAVVLDNTLSAIYGPISEYVDSETMWDAFASTYGAGRTSVERNITDFDPADWASEQGIGSWKTRARAVRGGRYREGRYGFMPGGTDEPFVQGARGKMPPPVTFTGETIPGYDEWSENMVIEKGIAPNAFDDYFYDISFQEALKSRVKMAWQSRGMGFMQKPLFMPSIESYMSELERLIPDEQARESQINDIKREASIKALDYSERYKEYVMPKIEDALQAVQTRQDVLKERETIEDLNEVVRRKQRLEKTKASLDKVSATNSTTEAHVVTDRALEAAQRVIDYNEDVYKKNSTFYKDYKSIKSKVGEILFDKGEPEQKKKSIRNKGLPLEVIDTGIPNYSGVQTIKVHRDIVDSLDKAMKDLEAEGVTLQIEDSYRYPEVQREQYEASLGGVKAGLVAHPNESYHVKGLAFDLAQIDEMRNDPRVSQALTGAGFVQSRPEDEWWHWSIKD